MCNLRTHVTENVHDTCEIIFRRMSQNNFEDKSTLVQVMAWCLTAPSHYLNQCWPRSMSPYGATGLLTYILSSWVTYGMSIVSISEKTVSIQRCHLTSIGKKMKIKIRLSNKYLFIKIWLLNKYLFTMGIPIQGKAIFILMQVPENIFNYIISPLHYILPPLYLGKSNEELGMFALPSLIYLSIICSDGSNILDDILKNTLPNG